MSSKLNPPKTLDEALERVQQAQSVIAPMVKQTELSRSKFCSQVADKNIFLKFENSQITGSFKIRGALNKLNALDKSEKTKGVIASSAGNHSQGVAYGAQSLGLKAKIVMPETSPLIKIVATQGYGAEVILKGDFYDEAFSHAKELADQQGLTFVHPYEDDKIIAGQGTVALEILKAQPDIDLIVVPIGGGGLISGIAMAAKAIKPSCKVIGVQTHKVPSMYNRRYTQQQIRSAHEAMTIADGIAVKRPSEEIFKGYIERFVDDIVTVEEAEIASAMVLLLERKKTVVEGAGAVAMAAALNQKLKVQEKNVAVILSGGNVDLNTVSKLIHKGLIESGRQAQISVIVDDFPGTLNKITSVIGEKRANILQVSHNRGEKNLGLRETRIDFLLETRNSDHSDEIRQALSDAGMRVL